MDIEQDSPAEKMLLSVLRILWGLSIVPRSYVNYSLSRENFNF